MSTGRIQVGKFQIVLPFLTQLEMIIIKYFRVVSNNLKNITNFKIINTL
eukprot:SAG31_NODE_700_length_12734_cov_212.705105_10_plen_49_part_00